MVMAPDLGTEIRGFESHKVIFLLYYFSHLGFDNVHFMKFPAFHTS